MTTYIHSFSAPAQRAFAKALATPWVGLLLALFLGAAAWGSSFAALALAPLVVPLWATRSTRLFAWLVMFLYYLTAARGLPFGAAQFFGDGTPAVFSVVLWLGASLALSAPWALLWARRGFYWRVPLALLLCAVPPIGLVGWANPVTAAGVFFPALGFLGVAAMVASTVGLCYWPGRTSLALIVLSLAGSVISTPPAPGWIEAHQTSFGGSGGAGRDYVRDYAANLTMIDLAARSASPFVLFPETVAGVWSSPTASLWADAAAKLTAAKRTALVGAEVPIEGTEKTRNALVFVGYHSGELVQRIPVPFSMWTPWAESGTTADLLGSGVGQLGGRRVAVLICYEQLLVWPVLLSQAASPEAVIGAANGYWAAGTSIPGIQLVALRAWSRLFGVPFVSSVNF